MTDGICPWRRLTRGSFEVFFSNCRSNISARVWFRVCVHVPSSPPSAAVTEKKRTRPAVAGTTEKWTRRHSELFPVCFCSLSPHYISVSPFDYYNGQRAECNCRTRDGVCDIMPEKSKICFLLYIRLRSVISPSSSKYHFILVH